MIDKKEHEALKEYLQEIGADHLGLLELIDLKGKDALDKASEIASDSGPIEASRRGLHRCARSSPDGRSSARQGRSRRRAEAG